MPFSEIRTYSGEELGTSSLFEFQFQKCIKIAAPRYIVTIACVIGKSRMKGARVVTTLLPHGPEKPRGGSICRAVASTEVEIGWEPPRGAFTK